MGSEMCIRDRLEAMLNEKPFIASVVGGIIEHKKKDYWGIYVEPDNYMAIAKALLYIYTNKDNEELKLNIRRNRTKKILVFMLLTD